MPEDTQFKFGGATFPLSASTALSPLREADPSIYFALDYLAAMINHYAGARMVAEFAKTGVKNGLNPITSAVGHKVGYDPTAYLTQEQVKFPLLAIYRVQATYAEHTIAFDRETCEANITYGLPPLTPAQAERLVPMLKAVAAIVERQIDKAHDPSYTPPGSTLDGGIWAAAGLDRIGLISSKWVPYDVGGNLVFPTWQGTVQIVERTDYVPSTYENFTGSDVAIDLDVPPPETDVTDYVTLMTDIG